MNDAAHHVGKLEPPAGPEDAEHFSEDAASRRENPRSVLSACSRVAESVSRTTDRFLLWRARDCRFPTHQNPGGELMRPRER